MAPKSPSRSSPRPPAPDEAAPYYFTYIDKVPAGDILQTLQSQLQSTLDILSPISDERSLYRYAPGKWSIREMWNHVNDAERLFVFRALWFARGFDTPLPSFDQNVCVTAAAANEVPLAQHIEEFRAIRQASVAFFRHLPEAAWQRRGIASENPFTVNALAHITAGHVAHHMDILQRRYLEL